MKKSAIFTAMAIIISLVLAVPLAGCEGEVSFTTASLSEATMCLDVDDDSRPIDATKVFTHDTPEFYLSVKLSNAPNDTEVKAEWIYVKGEWEDVTDEVLQEHAITTDGTRYLHFWLSLSEGEWYRGDYKVVLYIDDKEKLTVPFTVE